MAATGGVTGLPLMPAENPGEGPPNYPTREIMSAVGQVGPSAGQMLTMIPPEANRHEHQVYGNMAAYQNAA